MKERESNKNNYKHFFTYFSMSNKELLLNFEEVSFSYKKIPVFKKLSLKIFTNDCVSFVGNSGCGKTTLIKLILNLLKPKKGKIYFFSNLAKSNKNKKIKNIDILKNEINIVNQGSSFYPELSAYENLKYFSIINNLKIKKEDIFSILKHLFLFDYKNIVSKNLSGGQKRRLEFSLALLNKPKLIILDEPFVGLDNTRIDDIIKIIRILNKYNIAIILISHRIGLVSKICEKVFVLENKKIKKILVKRGIGSEIFEKEIRRELK